MIDLIEIIFGIVAFTLIVNMMILILFARTKPVSTGDVTVEINGDPEKTITVPAGGKLSFQTLAEQDLFLSSACGGGGTCAQCKCQVFDGGGSILATEEAHFNNREKERFLEIIVPSTR